MNQLIILSGIPCSGKSTFRNNPIYKSWVIICRDDLREKYWGKNYKYTNENEKSVTAMCDVSFDLAVRLGHNILIDNTHVKEKYINEWIKRKPDNYELRVIFFDISLWKAHIRNILRWFLTSKWIPIKVMNDMYKNYKKIDKLRYL